MFEEAVSLGIDLSIPQYTLYTSPKRFRVCVAGRRWGKTYEALMELLGSAIQFPGSNNWYVTSTRKQAKTNLWKDLLEMVPSEWVRRVNVTELTIELRNGSVIRLEGAENYQKLRGPWLMLVILDEFADMKPDVWVVFRPMLGDLKLIQRYGQLGRCLFIGTPRGFNHFYDRWYEAKMGRSANGRDLSKEWEAFHWTTLQGGNISPEELESMKDTLSAKDYRQETEASFEALGGRVYHAYANSEWPDGNLDAQCIDRGGVILAGMDFNVNPMTANFSSRIERITQAPNAPPVKVIECHTWGELVIPDSNTVEMGREIRARFPDRQIVIFPDPSGDKRKTSAQVGVTDISILKGYGFSVYEAGVAWYPIKDRFNTTNGLLCNARGQRRQRINPTECPALVKSLNGYCYKENTSIPDKDSGLDHATDALGYAHMGCFPHAAFEGSTSEVLM